MFCWNAVGSICGHLAWPKTEVLLDILWNFIVKLVLKITDEKKINFRKKVSEKLLTKKACSGTIYEQCESIELYSSIAQPVEHAAVNRRVVGSSPTGGAIKEIPSVRYLFFLFYMRTNQRACAASQPNRHCLARSAQRARRVKQTAQCAVCSQSGSQKTWSLVRVQLGEPSVMVYKSFLIDHHFCIFRGIFAPFWAIS